MDIYQIKEYNPKHRVLQATTNIKEGQLVMQCQPISHAVISNLRTKICANCLKQQQQLLRCSKCKVMFYCNKQCQREDWSIHKQQCKAYQLISGKSFKITSQFVLLVRTYFATQKNKEIKEKVQNFLQLSQYQSPNTRQYFVEMTTVFIQNFNIQKSQQTFSFIIKLLGIISINTFTIQDYLFNHQGIAIGLYSPANFINHSCNPNSVQVFNGKQLNIICLKSISPQEEITISYLDETLSMNERNKILKESYYFDCACYQCLAEKAIQKDLTDVLCEKCEEGYLVGLKQNFMCKICKVEYSNQQLKQKRLQIQKLQKSLTQQNSYEKNIKSFYSLKKLLKFTNPFYSKVIQNLYHQALQKSFFEDAYKIMKAYFINFPKWYHMQQGQKFHILLLWKYAEMGKLAMHLSKLKKAVEYTQKAIEILDKSRLSSQFVQVRDLKKRYEQLKIQCRMNATPSRR